MKMYKRKMLALFHKSCFRFFSGMLCDCPPCCSSNVFLYFSYRCFHAMDDRQNNGRKHIELHEVAVVGFCADGDEACMYMAFINVWMHLKYFSCVVILFYVFRTQSNFFWDKCFATMLRAQRVNRLSSSFQLKIQSRYASHRCFNATSRSGCGNIRCFE